MPLTKDGTYGVTSKSASPLVLTAGDLCRPAKSVTADTNCGAVIGFFLSNSELFTIVVLSPRKAVLGVLRRIEILTKASTRFFIELHRKKPCTFLMDLQPLRFDYATPLSDMADAVTDMQESHLLDGFIVTRDDVYVGSGRFNELLGAVNQMQLAIARNSNPLTLLPGNALIQVQIDIALKSGMNFCVVYFDLDHFKPFNDVYGYKLGDDVILVCAQTINRHLNDGSDFLGHVGGDDFIAISYNRNWEPKIQQILSVFDQTVKSFFKPEHLAAGGYKSTNRQGQQDFHSITSLSAGVVEVEPGAYQQHAELATVAAEAKKQAKKTSGSSYFIERRKCDNIKGLTQCDLPAAVPI